MGRMDTDSFAAFIATGLETLVVLKALGGHGKHATRPG